MINSSKPYIVISSRDRIAIPFAPSCVTVIDDVRKRYDSNGNAFFESHGKIDIIEYINSFDVGCTLEALLSRCALLPLNNKIQMVNQNPDGVSADLSNMPTDGTSAFLMLNDLKKNYPHIIERFSRGESFNDIINSLVSTNDTNSSINSKESEVESNG